MAMNTYENGSTESRDDDLRRTILDFTGNYMGNDPLEPWLRCIKLLKEMNPPGSVQIVLQEVLHLAATTFLEDIRYKSDLRYLKVWIQYADCCLDRAGIFPFLETKGIGLDHGLFYEAYALLLESSRDYSKADYVFQLGISRGAQPLERVTVMHNNFLSRMLARQRRKARQEQEHKALLARLGGGAQMPLAGSHGIEGLPMLPSFLSSAREEPLPDMQDGAGSYGGPAPVCVGSKIYESTALIAESSFEEERVRHWLQKTAPLLHSVPHDAPLVFKYGQNKSISVNPVTQTLSNEVHQNPNRPSARMDSTLNKMPGQKEETSNGYLSSVSNLSQAVNVTSSQPVSTGNVYSRDSFGIEKFSMRPTTLHAVGAGQERASLLLSHRDMPKTGKSYTNENMAGMERTANYIERAGQSEILDDVTIVTKSVTDDIMAMFGDPRPSTLHSEAAVSLPSARKDLTKAESSYINVNMAGMERNASSAEIAGQSEILDDVTDNTTSVTDDIMAMFGDTRPSALHSEAAASVPSAHKGLPKAEMSYTNEIMAGMERNASSAEQAGQSDALNDVTNNITSVTDDIMAMFSAPRAATLHSETAAQQHASLPASNKDLSKIGRSYINENVAETEFNASYAQLAGKSEILDDLTIVTKSVTDDIMSMFSGSQACGNPRPRVVASNFMKTNVAWEGTPSMNGGLRAPVVLSQPIDKPANTSISRNSPSTSIPSDSESRTLNVTADYKLITSTNQQQHSQIAAAGKDVAAVGIKSEVPAHISWSSGSHFRNGAATLHTREFVSVHKDGTSSSTSVVDNFAPNQKHLEAVAVGQRITKENRSSILLDTSKSEVGIVPDRSTCKGKRRLSKEDSVYDDSNVRSTPSRKRSSWSTSAKGTQCIYLSDEEEQVDNRENKKQRVQFISTTSNEGSGALDSGTPVMERSEVKREQQHPSQYSPATWSNPRKVSPRNILEPTLSRTEHSKPGGQVYPWDPELQANFLKDLNPPLSKYKGHIYSSKKYSGKVSLASLASSKSGVKNKLLELGCSKYQLKGCTGRGAFAQVYLAEALSNTGDNRRVVLKVQKPPCPWEFYIYRQLDMRIPSEVRCSFGCAQNIHIYADCSFMECEFGQYGTLQDVINSYLSKGQRMDEVLCIFYTIEMLQMLENLHKVRLIHGDFKPDNLLIRSSSETLGVWAPDKPGFWKQQGVCLIDWGRSIDINLFAEGTEFVGDSKTDGFRCTEMIEKKPWTFQVDTYGLCGVAHCLLHGSYMEIDRRATNAASQVVNRPKAPYKRYWNVSLWQNFFETLLNLNTGNSYDILANLRRSFEDYLRSDSSLMKKLREFLVKQNTMLLTRK